MHATAFMRCWAATPAKGGNISRVPRSAESYERPEVCALPQILQFGTQEPNKSSMGQDKGIPLPLREAGILKPRKVIFIT